MNELRDYFPIFERYPDLAYLDNAATTQKPKVVLDVVDHFSRYENANIHRGVYDLSNDATRRYEKAREKIAQYLGAKRADNIGFTAGTTESVNIVARSFSDKRILAGDNIVISLMEHHSNFLPWQEVARERNAELRIIPLTNIGELDYDGFARLLDEKTKIVSVTHISNTLGTINDIEKIIAMAHEKGIPVMIDAAQSVSLFGLNASTMGFDFLTFSGHKAFGPFGTGILYVGDEFLGEIGPYNTGGGMVKHVTVDKTSFRDFPYNLEAGTPNVPGIIGLGEAIGFIDGFDKKVMRDHVKALGEKLREGLGEIPGVEIIGNARERTGIVSFTVDEIHPHDIASFLNKDQIAVRAGMHCTQPLLDHLGAPATVRASFSIYNSEDEVDRLLESIKGLIRFWS